MSENRGAAAYAAEMLRDLPAGALHDHDLPFRWRVFLEALEVRSQIRRAVHDLKQSGQA